MMALTFDIHLLTPLLATRLGGDPNSAISYPYVPGSVIRGALANRYHRQHPKLEMSDSDSRRLFFDGSTRYLNAYPLDRLKKRTLLVPLSWLQEKEEPLVDGAAIYDFAVDEAFLDHAKQIAKLFFRIDSVPDNQWPHDEDDDEHYWEPEPPTVEFTDVEWQIAIHTARERLKGRATQEEGAVFRYQALALGQSFGGAILLSSPDDAKTVKELLERGDFWLGKSRSAGYGQVRIENLQQVKSWHETVGDKGLSQGRKVTIMLLSDVLLRTNEGVFADQLSEDMLPEPLKRSLKLVDSFKRVVPVGGFNRKWGLPLDQAYVIKAGSVFVFEVTQNVSAAKVRAVENAGIGERRAEGFGRIAINWLRAPELTVREITTEDSSDSAAESSDSTMAMTPLSQALAEKMVERLLRRDLDRRLAGYVQRLKLNQMQEISNAQLSRLRTIALNALPKRDIKRLLDFLGDNNLKAKARTQFEMARIDDRQALEWFREQLKAPTTIWQHLGEGGAQILLPRIGTVKAELTEDLAKEYTIRLIAGILHRAAKERKLEQKEGKGATNG